jgi:serine/threonine protein kinase
MQFAHRPQSVTKDEDYGNYEKLKEIGHGANGIVYQVKRKSDGGIFAMKKINIDTNFEIDSLAEVKTMREMDHPNIIKCYDIFKVRNGSQLCIVMDYASRGDLR